MANITGRRKGKRTATKRRPAAKSAVRRTGRAGAAAPTPWQALRVLAMAEAAKWAVSLSGLASLLSGRAGLEAASAAPGAVVIGFCVAWAAPLLALVKRN